MTLVMIPLAVTELGTDGWITAMMTPAMTDIGLSGGWVLIYTMALVLVLRLFAGPLVHKFSPLGLLAISAAIAAVGSVAALEDHGRDAAGRGHGLRRRQGLLLADVAGSGGRAIAARAAPSR